MGAGRQDQPSLITPLRNAARRPQSDYTLITVLSGAEKLGAEGTFAASRENLRTAVRSVDPEKMPYPLPNSTSPRRTRWRRSYWLQMRVWSRTRTGCCQGKRILGVFGHQDSFRVRAPQYARLRDNIHRR